MKNSKNIYALAMVLCAVGLSFLSCSSDSAIDDSPTLSRGETKAVNFVFNAPSLQDDAPNLKIDLYVFDRTAGQSTDYSFSDKITITSYSGQRIALPLAKLTSSEFRFVFLAYEEGGPILNPINASTGNDLAANDGWSDLRLKYDYSTTDAESFSMHTYYGVTNMTGQQIIEAGEVRGDLERLVGQMVFNFFKGSDAETPLPIDRYVDGNHDEVARRNVRDPETSLLRPETDEELMARKDGMFELVGSVMDRVYRIEIDYSDMTDRLRFDPATFKVIPDGTTTESLKQALDFGNQSDNTTAWRVYFPLASQPNVVDAEIADGSAKVKGAYFFPSETGVKAVIKLYYYDTTITCEETAADAVHDEPCYDKRVLTLTLPAPGGTTTLPVIADHMTVTRAAIPMNRIIDLPRSGGFVIDDYVWSF